MAGRRWAREFTRIFALIAARELGMTPDRVRVMHTRTDKVPNTSATAASCGTDLNGAAVKNACDTLRARFLPFAMRNAGGKKRQRPPIETGLVFAENRFVDRKRPMRSLAAG